MGSKEFLIPLSTLFLKQKAIKKLQGLCPAAFLLFTGSYKNPAPGQFF
jgi:hypothetical protein